jgi:NAD(P)-dependent dehydrogenase (short-subunit alcohol dehydrogenase family)
LRLDLRAEQALSLRLAPGNSELAAKILADGQTSSTNGLVGHPYYDDYNAAKAGVIELTKSMALELVPKIR